MQIGNCHFCFFLVLAVTKTERGEDNAVFFSLQKPLTKQEDNHLKKSTYTTYDELPLFLNADLVAQVLGISISSAYELMHEKDFPSMRIGNRLIVPKEKFKTWIDEKTGK